MARRSDKKVLRMGAIALVGLLLVMAAAFNLQKFPGFRGVDYSAELNDASGLHSGNVVQVAGVKVGSVNELRIEGDRVIVEFDAKDVELGDQTRASIQVLNLLGEKYLELIPEGKGLMKAGSTIPLDRTEAGYDIVGALGDLTERTEQINIEKLSEALTTVADTLNTASPEVRDTFSGISRLSADLAKRDADIEQLLKRAERVTKLLEDRREDLIDLMKEGQLVFNELRNRKEAISRLIRNTTTLGNELQGLVRDNQKEIGPAMAELNDAIDFLVARKKNIKTILDNLSPYVQVLINVLGTGPWFDAYVPNVAGLLTGEFYLE